MPTPQEDLCFVEQAGEPVMDIISRKGGQDAHPTRRFMLCGTGRRAYYEHYFSFSRYQAEPGNADALAPPRQYLCPMR